MELSINSNEKELNNYKSDNLEDLLDEIRTGLGREVISKLIVDGDEFDTKNLLNNPDLEEIDEIEISTMTVNEVIKQSMADLQEYLPKVIKGFNQASAQIDAGNTSNGYEILNYALQGLRWSMDVMSHGSKLSGNEKLMQRFNETSQSLNTMLNSVRERIDKGNSDELVTIISESFQPELDKLQAMADELTYHYDAEDVEPQVDDDLIDKD
ncbi:MAG: hypothetical protein ACQEQP_07320 [Bacillota bacterium]